MLEFLDKGQKKVEGILETLFLLDKSNMRTSCRKILAFFQKPEVDCPLSDGNTQKFEPEILRLVKKCDERFVDDGCKYLDHWVGIYDVMGRSWQRMKHPQYDQRHLQNFAYFTKRDVQQVRSCFHKLRLKITNYDQELR